MSIPHVTLDQQQELASTGIEMELGCRDKLPHLGKVIWDGALTLSSTSIGKFISVPEWLTSPQVLNGAHSLL